MSASGVSPSENVTVSVGIPTALIVVLSVRRLGTHPVAGTRRGEQVYRRADAVAVGVDNLAWPLNDRIIHVGERDDAVGEDVRQLGEQSRGEKGIERRFAFD
jgi:hypothetical protein